MAVLQRSMNFFTDVSHGTKSPLFRDLLAQKGGKLLSSFLNRVSSALQEEYKNPPTVDLRVMLSFEDLVRQQGNQTQPRPALHPTQFVLVQLSCFIT